LGESQKSEGERPYNVDDEEDAAEARKYAGEALTVLAEIADNPMVERKLREEAGRSLEERLVHLKGLAENPDTPDHSNAISKTHSENFGTRNAPLDIV
jgi:hypothetical protein